jgi:SAM-dependent methyltransferase
MGLHTVIPTPPGFDVPCEKPLSHHLHLVYRYLMRDLREQLPTLTGRVVDAGCGLQPYRHLLGPGVTEYVGVDRKGPLTAPDVEGDVLALPLPDASFDAALSTQVLEHVTDPALALREIARVLRPGGRLVLTCPGTWPHHETPYDFFRYTRFGLEHLLRAAGLEVVEIREQGGVWATIGQLTALELFHLGDRGQRFVPLLNRLIVRLEERGGREEQALNWLVLARKPAA